MAQVTASGAVELTREVVMAALGEQELDDGSVRARLPAQIRALYVDLRKRLTDRAAVQLVPRSESFQLALQVNDALGADADLSLVWPRFAVWLLVDPVDGAVRYAPEHALAAVRGVATLYERVCTGDIVTRAQWSEAAAAAYSWPSAKDAADAGVWGQAAGPRVEALAGRAAALAAAEATWRQADRAVAGAWEAEAWEAEATMVTRRQGSKLVELIRS